MGALGRTRVKENFSIDAQIRQIEDIYGQLVG